MAAKRDRIRTTQEWLNFQLTESERYQNLILNQKLNDASGLGNGLMRLIKRGKTDRPSGVLLVGPAGCGKHNAAYHILQALDRENCAPVFFTGESLAEGVGDFQELTERLNALLDQFYDRHQGLCIVLEEPDGSEYGTQLYQFLGRTAHEYKSNLNELPALFLILIAEKCPVLPSMLQELMLVCRCTVPNAEQRENFLADRAKSIKTYVSLKYLGEITEGCSYSTIGEIADSLGFIVDTTDRAPDEETMLRLVDEAQGGGSEKTDDRTAAAIGRLEAVLNGISQRIAKMGTIAASAPAVQSNQSDNSNTETAEAAPTVNRDEFEKMPVNQIATEIFGEERALELIQY